MVDFWEALYRGNLVLLVFLCLFALAFQALGWRVTTFHVVAIFVSLAAAWTDNIKRAFEGRK